MPPTWESIGAQPHAPFLADASNRSCSNGWTITRLIPTTWSRGNKTHVDALARFKQ